MVHDYAGSSLLQASQPQAMPSWNQTPIRTLPGKPCKGCCSDRDPGSYSRRAAVLAGYSANSLDLFSAVLSFYCRRISACDQDAPPFLQFSTALLPDTRHFSVPDVRFCGYTTQSLPWKLQKAKGSDIHKKTPSRATQ